MRLVSCKLKILCYVIDEDLLLLLVEMGYYEPYGVGHRQVKLEVDDVDWMLLVELDDQVFLLAQVVILDKDGSISLRKLARYLDDFCECLELVDVDHNYG